MKKIMQKHKLLIIIALLLLVKLGTYYYDDFIHFVDEKVYNHYVSEFEKIRPIEAVNLASKNGSEILIYFGRDTCPHCVKTIRNVYDISKEAIERNIPFYYIEEESKLSERDHELITDVFQLEYIPSIIKISDTNIEIFDYQEIEKKEYRENFSAFLK